MTLKNSIQVCSLFAASILMAGVTVMAAQEPGMSNPGTTQQQPMPNETTTPAGNGQPSMANMAVSAFIRSVFENDEAQVQMSQLAQQKAAGDDVKQFSEQMVNVHNKLDQQFEPMAKQLGVSQPKNPPKKYKKELEKLQGLSGESFDTEYLQAMGDAQQQSIKDFDKESKDNLNPSAQQVVKADVPVLEQNYQVLEKIAQAHKVTLEAQSK